MPIPPLYVGYGRQIICLFNSQILRSKRIILEELQLRNHTQGTSTIPRSDIGDGILDFKPELDGMRPVPGTEELLNKSLSVLLLNIGRGTVN